MKGNFEKLTAPLLNLEGGLSNRPLKDDPGGLTNFGITQARYNVYRKAHGLARQSVANIVPGEVRDIMREYWNEVRGDELPSGIDWSVFDFSFNSGAAQAIKELQRTLLVNADGALGPITLDAAKAAPPIETINEYNDRRMAFLRRLKNWNANKNGWTTRVSEVRKSSLALAVAPKTAAVVVAPQPATASAKAPESAVAKAKTADGQGISLTGLGLAGEKARQWANATIFPHVGLDTTLGRAAWALFTLMMVVGFGLLLLVWLRKLKDQGGLTGILATMLK